MSYGLIFFYRYFHFSNLLHIGDCQFSWYYENISIISKDIYLCKCQDNFQIIARYLWHWIWMVHYGPTIVFGHLVSHLGESDRSDALSGVHILKILMSWKECYSLIFLNFTPIEVAELITSLRYSMIQSNDVSHGFTSISLSCGLEWNGKTCYDVNHDLICLGLTLMCIYDHHAIPFVIGKPKVSILNFELLDEFMPYNITSD